MSSVASRGDGALTPRERVVTPRDDSRSPFFVTGAPESVRAQRTRTDVQKSAEGLANLTQQINEEVKRRLTPQQYEVGGGHSLKVDGINQSGCLQLSVRLADEGQCDPWTDVIADEFAASTAQSELDSQPQGPGTHELLSQHLPDVYTDHHSGGETAPTTPVPSHSHLHAFSQPSTPTAATPTLASPSTSFAASPPTLEQPFSSATERHTSQSAISGIRTPGRASSVYSQKSLSQAAQQAESSRAAVEQLVSIAISTVNHAHNETVVPPSVLLGDPTAAAATAAEVERQHYGHGPFVGVPLQAIPGACSIAILVVGTRGDVQPFLAIARELRRYGHRVRLATHSIYRKFVEDHQIEFYPLGGDPTILSEFVVRNRGILPGGGAKGLLHDIREQEEQLKEIVWSTWPACTEPDPMRPSRPFRATAIISNPPIVSHVCCAEALQVPLHLMFTMPWTATKKFPHPMAVVQSINVAGAISSLPNEFISGAANYYSYRALDLYLWMGFSGVLEEFRKDLGLPAYPMATTGPAHALASLRLPFTYLWSPSLQPKPQDWGSHISVTGFVFLDEDAKDYTPPADLVAFLNPRYQPPIYIGFGSLVLADPKATTEIIYAAARVSGKRVLLSRGWAELGSGVVNKPDNVFLLSDCPHAWLFPKCSAAVHHGGAGTTAAALRAGLPTLVVPFFGDQPFWGDSCLAAGVGPRPVPIARLTQKDLVAAFAAFDTPEVRDSALRVAAQMSQENGRSAAVQHFHKCLDQHRTVIQPGTWKAPRPPYQEVSMSALATVRSSSLTRMHVDISAAMDVVTVEMKRSMQISTSAISTAKNVGATVTSLVSSPGAIVGRSLMKEKKDSFDSGSREKRGKNGFSMRGKRGTTTGFETTQDHVTAVMWAKGGGDDVEGVKGHNSKSSWWSFLVCGACTAVQDSGSTPLPPTATVTDKYQISGHVGVQNPVPQPRPVPVLVPALAATDARTTVATSAGVQVAKSPALPPLPPHLQLQQQQTRHSAQDQSGHGGAVHATGQHPGAASDTFSFQPALPANAGTLSHAAQQLDAGALHPSHIAPLPSPPLSSPHPSTTPVDTNAGMHGVADGSVYQPINTVNSVAPLAELRYTVNKPSEYSALGDGKHPQEVEETATDSTAQEPTLLIPELSDVDVLYKQAAAAAALSQQPTAPAVDLTV